MQKWLIKCVIVFMFSLVSELFNVCECVTAVISILIPRYSYCLCWLVLMKKMVLLKVLLGPSHISALMASSPYPTVQHPQIFHLTTW
eukprot:m.92766 g.92766  ORF g.92766 m.92766 type:complete len:87 (-) comp12367_c0_seq2:693-953(-)